MNYHIRRLVLSLLYVGAFVAADIWWCSFCRLKHKQELCFSIKNKKIANFIACWFPLPQLPPPAASEGSIAPEVIAYIVYIYKTYV
jgi:hypothetical protein